MTYVTDDKEIQILRDPNVLFSAVCPYCKKPTRVSRLWNMECCAHKYPIPKAIPERLMRWYVLNLPDAEDEYNDRMEEYERRKI